MSYLQQFLKKDEHYNQGRTIQAILIPLKQQTSQLLPWGTASDLKGFSVTKKMQLPVYLIVLALFVFVGTAWAGPLVLMGIDAEDGGPGGHGPISNYVDVVNSILGNVTNSGSNILVIGGGKSPVDDPTSFWNAIDTAIPSQSVTYVNGAAAISAQSFDGFAVLAIVSSDNQTPFGGKTDAESNALNARAADVAAFVNAGGGLLGFSDVGHPTPFGYLAGVGAFDFNFFDYQDISPTADGNAVGITDALDVCCWHNTFTKFPGFLNVLATEPSRGEAAAVGGATVTVTPLPAPNTLLLLGAGLFGFCIARKRILG